MLRIGRNKFYDLVNEQKLKVVKIGRRTLVRRSDINEFAGLKDRDAPPHDGSEGTEGSGAGELSSLVRISRAMRKMTLRDLEDKSGVSNALISQIETGKVKDPSWMVGFRLAAALDIPVDVLGDVASREISLRKAKGEKRE